MENVSTVNGQVFNFKKAKEVLKQFVPVTEFRRNMNSVLDTLDDVKSIFIVKGSSVVGVLIKKEEYLEMNDYIERLEDQISILKAQQNNTFISEDEFEKKYKK